MGFRIAFFRGSVCSPFLPGACGDAPVMLVNNRRMCSWMTPEQIDRLLDELK